MEQMTATRPDDFQQAAPENITLGNLNLSLTNYRATIGGVVVDLTYQEFEFLRRLTQNPDRVVSFTTLAQDLWDHDGQRETRRLNVLAFRLRAKLADCHPYRIETVRGRGYGLLMARNEAAASDD